VAGSKNMDFWLRYMVNGFRRGSQLEVDQGDFPPSPRKDMRLLGIHDLASLK